MGQQILACSFVPIQESLKCPRFAMFSPMILLARLFRRKSRAIVITGRRRHRRRQRVKNLQHCL